MYPACFNSFTWTLCITSITFDSDITLRKDVLCPLDELLLVSSIEITKASFTPSLVNPLSETFIFGTQCLKFLSLQTLGVWRTPWNLGYLSSNNIGDVLEEVSCFRHFPSASYVDPSSRQAEELMVRIRMQQGFYRLKVWNVFRTVWKVWIKCNRDVTVSVKVWLEGVKNNLTL